MIILLADDERLIRLGLETMINELYPYEHTFYHAKNGNEVINQVKLHSPDIVFLDIKMPSMNGLEALEQCKSLVPSTIWIILSGYAEFAFAQKALSLGASHYLLKPISISELKQVMEDILNKHYENFIRNNAIFSSMVYQSFNLYDSLNIADISFLPDAKGQYQIYVFLIDNPIDKAQCILEHNLYQKLLHYFADPKNDLILHSLFFLNTGELCLVTEKKASIKGVGLRDLRKQVYF
jgi:two-component system response regulator YesN